MRCDLLCGLCRKRWPYSGDSPVEALRGHTLTEHPDVLIGASPLVSLTSDADGTETMALAASLLPPLRRYLEGRPNEEAQAGL